MHHENAGEQAQSETNYSKGYKMEGINSDKVNINLGGGESGGGSMAAVIAALGNRNQGNDNAALIAALGNRNGGNEGGMAALIAAMGNRGHHDEGGMNAMWPILLLALLGKRGGLGGGDDCATAATAAGLSPAQAAMLQTLLEGQSSLRAEVPTTALETQNAVLRAVSELALGTQQAVAGVKDSVQLAGAACLTATASVKDAVQNGFALQQRDLALINQNILEQGCRGREATQAGTTAILSRIDRNEIDTLRHERDRFERGVEVASLRSQVEVNQTVNTTTNQAQAQFQVQSQFQDINSRLSRLFDRIDIVHQEARATNSNVIAGNTGAVVTGPQTSTPTNVNA